MALLGLFSPLAVQAAPIAMPEGATVWMEFGANSCIPAAGQEGGCVGSDLPGLAPPNGIPLVTFGSAMFGPATGYAEILPDRVRTYSSSPSSAGVAASFLDTYSVHGTESGTFEITVTLAATGTFTTWPGSVHQLIGAAVDLEIGTWNPAAYWQGNTTLPEQFRVTPFGPSAGVRLSAPSTSVSAPVTIPFSGAATWTLTVGVGDTFDIAYGVNAGASKGTVDMLNTAGISWELPEGVWLTSELGGTFGQVPEPSTFALVAFGLIVLARRTVGPARRAGREERPSRV